MSFSALYTESLQLLQRKYPIVVCNAVLAIAAAVVYRLLLMPEMKGWSETGEWQMMWTRFFLPQLGMALIGMLVFIYSVLYLCAEADKPLLSVQRMRRTVREIPNVLVTFVCIVVRLLPYVLLTVIIFSFPVLIMTTSVGGTMGPLYSGMYILVLIAYLPIFWGMATLELSPFIAIASLQRYWAATRESVRVYKSNRLLMLALMVPYLLLFASAMAAVMQAGTAASAGEPAFAGNIWYNAVSILIGVLYPVVFSAVVRNTLPEEKRTAV